MLTMSNLKSFATPLTAGLIGLMWSMDPTQTAQQVEDRLKASCDNIGSATTFGYGRINSYNALMAVQAGMGGGGGSEPTTTTTTTTTTTSTAAGGGGGEIPVVEKYICKKTNPGPDEICLNGALSGGVCPSGKTTSCGNGGKFCHFADCPDGGGGGGGGDGGGGSCSSTTCAGCPGGGECRAVGCTWSKGNCS